MKMRQEFVLCALAPGAKIAALCRAYEISRKTGYKWIARFKQDGLLGLDDQSRRPTRSPELLSGIVVQEIIRLRIAHPTWGPKKIHPFLVVEFGRHAPARSSIARVLERTGLAVARPTTLRYPVTAGRQRVHVRQCNDLWTVDFKGWWTTRDQARCEPLSVRDAYSRFILTLALSANTTGKEVRRVFTRLFETYGMPKAILVDNGPPFGTPLNPLGMSEIAGWWWSLGIEVHHSRPRKPQDNGGHERMHRDIAAEVQTFPARNLREQQIALEHWRHEFNHVRPHEALGQKTPAAFYKKSQRRWRERQQPQPPRNAQLRKLGTRGQISFRGAEAYVTSALAHQVVGVQPENLDTFRVWFCNLLIGTLRLTHHKQGPTITFEWATRKPPFVTLATPRLPPKKRTKKKQQT